MQYQRLIILLLVGLLAAALLSGCIFVFGEGGGDGGVPPTPTPQFKLYSA